MPDQRDTRDVLRLMPWFFAGMVIFAFVAALTQADCWAAWGLILTWAFASMVSGGAIGFLFGVPKTIQSDKTDATQGTSASGPSSDANRATSLQGSYRQQVNTNLTEISDWLTKIIVGLGLIKLARLPSYLSDTAGALAAGIGGTPAARALAMGIIVSFSIGGFLLGYLTTRLFLAEALSHADQLALLALQDVRQQVASTQVQVNSIESRQSVLKESVFDAQAGGGTTIRSLGPRTGEDLDAGDRAGKAVGEDQLLATLQTMADDYLRIQSPDWAERVQLKDKAAAEMAKFVLSNNLSRNSLVELAKRTGNEGVVLALATAINTSPRRGDLERLLAVGPGLTRLHVKYHVLVAVGAVVRSGFVPRDNLAEVRHLVETYYAGADSSLSRLVTDTLSLIDTAMKRG